MSDCPLPYELLVDLVAGDLAPDEADAAEAHVFGCAVCGAAYEALARLVGAVRDLVPPVLSVRQKEKLAAAGARVVVTRARPDTRPTARFAPDVDLLIHELEGDLSNADSVDVDVVMPAMTLELVHVPFDREGGVVRMACQRHFEALGPTVFRVHVHEGGQRRTVGDYVIEHVWR